ncbi:Protein of unknown function DUF2294 [Stanieria cyanosphaera PCC 7437]|uniref:Na+-translocating membrane potential-generating system MpsC domain-containing protein n=1 Tax=Stanieria cyanosphaera (strain ATCC 29371 / PCC 7437) TaxID=111780 RepID=K9XWL0_STAC7|nr:DUF2294 domain-containing protein [Stanieria cyanosphaera]AFZ36471.1 Protein of unknown function DUF2294 [Stanieria cyanosphaera PCC 7437]
MSNQSINKKALEDILSPKIKSIYKNQLKHQLDNISYYLFERTLIVILEGTVTAPEKILNNHQKICLAKQVRKVIDNAIQPQIRSIIEEAMNVKVIDFLCDTTLESNCTSAIVIFERQKPLNSSI